uniref:Uncharacterized protein n=1 Tax=Daphnia galeata TaxID=27404 RepID=A0A8J2WC87_9CRUS|nr:unnamed protein product [Daphnia galeata]
MIFNVAVLLDGKSQAVFILAIVLCYHCKRRFFTSKKSSKWKNPFAHDSRIPFTPLVIKQEKRNRVLKNGRNRLNYWSVPLLELKTHLVDGINLSINLDSMQHPVFILKAFTKKLVGEKNWDAIVIGSGPGGLSSAALLSKGGLKVLVLEKHDTCGGGCHTFKEKGYEFDVGIHFVGGFTRQTLTHTLFDQISDGQIQWAQLDENYDRVIVYAMSPTKREYSIPSGLGVWEKQLIKSFTDERKSH